MGVLLYILKSLLKYENYQRYHGQIKDKFVADNSRELSKLFRIVDLFHSSHPEKDLTVQDLEILFHVHYPAESPKTKEIYESLFEKLSKIEVNQELIGTYLEDHVRRVKAAELSLVGIEVADGKKPYSELLRLAAELGGALGEGDVQRVEEFVTDDLEEIYDRNYSGKGLSWRLKTLNRMLGPIRKGDFGLIHARPETGKTTILASEVSFMAPQTEDPILWLNNEQAGEVVKARIYQAYFGITTHELFKNRQKYSEVYKKEIGKKILVYDSGSISRRDVDRIVANCNPSLVVIDQIDKLTGFDDDRNDLQLQKIYQYSRELAKKYCPVIGICQTGATGEGKKWLEMSDIANSKTGKAGEADFILGIGKSAQEGMEAIRHLHLCKNKLIGGELTIPELRHGKMEVLIKPEIARFCDLPERK